MKKVLLTLIIFSIPCICSAFSDVTISEGKKSLSFFLLPETDAFASSAISIDYGLRKDLALEFSYLGLGRQGLLTSNYQAGLHAKFDLGDFLKFNWLGIAGLGLTNTDQSGAATPLDLGLVPFRFINDRLYFSCPLKASIYSNGALLNYLPSFTFITPMGEIIFGYEGISSLASSAGTTGFKNRGLWAVGLRKSL